MFAVGQSMLDVLILIGTAGPIAVYFLTLGLVNSHARPLVVSTRTDFLALSIAVAPLALWALPLTMRFASAWWTALAVVLLGIGIYALRPRITDGFVIYNIPRDDFLALAPSIFAAAAPDADRATDTIWQSIDARFRITVSAFPLLRNVSIRLEGDAARVAASAVTIRREIQSRLGRIEQLPSPVGACLVLTGAAVAIVPMWLLTRHVHDLVEVVSVLLD